MKKYLVKITSMSLYVFIILSFVVNIYGHSGRTDSSGGHRDNQNKSGLGSYHYHCGGYPAHLHTNGVCPYTSSSNIQTIKEEKEIITPTSIEIDQESVNLEVGDQKTLSATIQPSNSEDKSISWSSNNEDIVTISKSGKIAAIKSGTAIITAKSSNGKIDSIEVNVKEVKKEQDVAVKTIATINTESESSNNNNSSGDAAAGLGITTVLGGGGYAIYKAMKKHQ